MLAFAALLLSLRGPSQRVAQPQRSVSASASAALATRPAVNVPETMQEPGSAVRQLATVDELQRELDAATGLTVIKFYAGYCRTCRAIKPRFDRVVRQVSQQAPQHRFFEVDAVASKALVRHCQVNALPRALIYDRGQLVSSMSLSKIKFAAFERKLAELQTSFSSFCAQKLAESAQPATNARVADVKQEIRDSIRTIDMRRMPQQSRNSM